jgi:ribose/xylose/arabinose/galactoside ABC-type transport system permease subunit
MKKPSAHNLWTVISENRLFLPLLALVLILTLDAIFIPNFFKIQVRDGDLYGRVIDIVRNASTVMVLAIGMTLVIATGGIDLSVGAIMAIAASVAAIMMNPVIVGMELPPDLMKFINDPNFTYSPLWQVITVTLIVAMICGLWNGILVSQMRIQPMVATLILMIAGRGIAQLITNGVRIQIFYKPYAFIGQGWIILPFSLYIVVFLYLITWLLTRKTAIGMFIESVGINAKASFYSGISEKKIKMLVYTFSGLCAGIAGLIASSNILSVVIGGTSMAGGRFSLLASLIGAIVIQAITTSMYALGVPAFALQAIKGLVVVFVILLYSEPFRALLRKVSTRKGASS